MNRNLKKIQLKCEYLKLELEDTSAEMAECVAEFNSKFGKYYSKKQELVEVEAKPNEETINSDEQSPLLNSVKKESKKLKLKKLYKKLSSTLHPDVGGDEELFLKFKEYYDSDNLFELINIATQYNIEYEFDDDDVFLMEKSSLQMENELKQIKGTLAWNWVHGDLNLKKSILKIVESETNQKIKIEDYLKESKSESDDNPKLLGQPGNVKL